MVELEAERAHDGLGQIAERFAAFDLDLPIDGRLVLEGDPDDMGASFSHRLLHTAIRPADHLDLVTPSSRSFDPPREEPLWSMALAAFDSDHPLWCSSLPTGIA